MPMSVLGSLIRHADVLPVILQDAAATVGGDGGAGAEGLPLSAGGLHAKAVWGAQRH